MESSTCGSCCVPRSRAVAPASAASRSAPPNRFIDLNHKYLLERTPQNREQMLQHFTIPPNQGHKHEIDSNLDTANTRKVLATIGCPICIARTVRSATSATYGVRVPVRCRNQALLRSNRLGRRVVNELVG